MWHWRFNPRPPCGERRAYQSLSGNGIRFQSTPSLRRATSVDLYRPEWYDVSIHALLAESDPFIRLFPGPMSSFNPRPPCGERLNTPSSNQRKIVFQSTPSLRRATGFAFLHARYGPFQSTPSLRRATGVKPLVCRIRQVSIHALLAESDLTGSWTPQA